MNLQNILYMQSVYYKAYSSFIYIFYTNIIKKMSRTKQYFTFLFTFVLTDSKYVPPYKFEFLLQFLEFINRCQGSSIIGDYLQRSSISVAWSPPGILSTPTRALVLPLTWLGKRGSPETGGLVPSAYIS